MTDQTSDKSTVAVQVGSIAADVRHILMGQARIEASVSEVRKEVREEVSRLDDRITAVEKFVWRAGGVTALALVLLPVVVTVVGWIITH